MLIINYITELMKYKSLFYEELINTLIKIKYTYKKMIMIITNHNILR